MPPEIEPASIPQPFRILSEQPPAGRKSFFSRLKDIGLIGIAGTIFAAAVGTAFQYARWYVEEKLERNADDFTAATRTFDSMNVELAKAQTLQEVIYFTYADAMEPHPPQKLKYLRERAAATFPAYEAQRMMLRQKIDAIIFDAQRHLDWASAPQHRDMSASTGAAKDPLSYGKLKQAKFDCTGEASMPHFPDEKTLDVVSFKGFDIDWRSIKHHLIVFNYCFRQVHDAIEPARVWAAGAQDASQPPLPAPPPAATRQQLDNNVQRLNGISMLGMIQVERVRGLNTPPDLFYFLRWKP